MYDILLMGLFGIVNLMLGFVIGVVVGDLAGDKE